MIIQSPTLAGWLKSILIFSLMAMMTLGGTETAVAVPGVAQAQIGGPQYHDYGLAALGHNDNISLAFLEKATNNDTSANSLRRFIQTDLLTYDIRRVLLNIGWENYTIGGIPHESWVDNWFSACDALGVENVLFVSQLTNYGIGSPWAMSLIRSDPAAQTYYQDGKPAPYVSVDNPDVLTQLKRDLATLYSYYGQHSSWIGIGTGSTSLDPYYGSNSSMPTLGYSNATVSEFANSQYFAADINSSGYDPNGALDILWAEFRNVQASIQLSSGNWQLSLPVSVFGNNTSGNSLAMRFFLPQRQDGLQIGWYGNKEGNYTGDMMAKILNDSGGKLVADAVLSSQSENSTSVTPSAGWQGPLMFQGTFNQGYYWLYLTSPSTNSSSSYQVFVRNYQVDNLYAQSLGSASSGHWSNVGETILWVRSANGTDLAISPYQQPLVIPHPQQSFVAESSFAFNTVYLFLSDRHLNPTNATITMVDTTLDMPIDSAILSQAETHGLQNWIPIPLSHIAVTQEGHSYMMTLTEPRSGISWIVAMRGLTASPPSGGFQGQSQFWLFRLALVNWGESHLDFTADVLNGVDSVSPGHPTAVGFTVPGSPGGQETLSNLSVFMRSNNPYAGFYPSNVSMTVSIDANNQTTGLPLMKPLQSLNLSGPSIPQRGWLNITGFNLTLSSGATYWAIFSANSSGTHLPMARLVSPYNLKVLVSQDGGSKWAYPVEGPTDSAFVARFADGKLVGNRIQDTPVVRVEGTTLFAQPFVESNSTEATGVFVGPIKAGGSPNNYLLVSINPDNGTGYPSGGPLAEGRLYSGNITLNFGLQFVQFTSAARLEAGQRYWIVIAGVGGKFGVEPVVYSYNQPGSPSSMVSRDSGFSWRSFSNLTTILSYRIATPLTPLPTYDTVQIFGNLTNYHGSDPNNDPSAGWNSYVQSLEIQREADLTTWFSANSGKPFDFYGTGNPGILANLQPQNFNYLPPSPAVSNCQELYTYLLSLLPSNAQQFPNVSNLSLLKSCQSDSPSDLLKQLNYIAYQGPQFGLNTSANVLVLGSAPTDKLSEDLLVGYNVTYVNARTNPGLATNAIHGSNRVIIVEPNTNVSMGLTTSMVAFVLHGGTLIVLGPLFPWLSYFGGNQTTTTQGSTSAFQKQLDFWTNNTIYFQKLKVGVSNGSLTADGPGLALGLTKFGLGEVVTLDKATQNLTQVSDSFVVLSNIVENSFSPGSVSPIWYDLPPSASTPQLIYGVKGIEGGQLLVWASNPSLTKEHVTINLNGSYYHLPNEWKVLDLSTLNVSIGTGNVVSIDTSLPSMSWAPFYVLSNNASSRGDYSSLVVDGDWRYPNQALLTTHGPANQSVLLALTTNSSVLRVTLGDRVTLQRTDSTSVLTASRQGWFLDTFTNTLFMKWESNSTSSLRIEYVPKPPAPPSPIFPESLFVWLFSFLLLAEILALAYLRLSRNRIRMKPGSLAKTYRPFLNMCPPTSMTFSW